MILQPESSDELARQLAAASATGTKIARVELSRVAQLLEHTPEDMTATVQAGMTLAAFQQALHRAGQWLPIDPPNAERLTIGDLLANDLSGPRRLGYGTIRDYLIGIKVALPEGQIIKAGGKVVKNVAGYDLCKLFIGARHSLGIIVEATFKLRPLPEAESFVRAECHSLDDLARTANALLSSAAEPIVLDAHNLTGCYTVVAAFAGIREDVDLQVTLARVLGFSETDSNSYPQEFWGNLAAAPRKTSVLPSRTTEVIAAINPSHFLAHLGNGIIYSRGGTPPAEQPMPLKLMERVKKAYDPKGILPSYTS
jgi:FAD/FMN-containing dehydrogenase